MPRAAPVPRRTLPADEGDLRAFRVAVLAWFERDGRRLRFRAQDESRPDPWGVLVSEVMAQQTQVARVEDRWPAFMAEYPTPAALAAAPPAAAIRAWRGLGYNRRVLALQRAAREISASGGDVPSGLAELEALPGIGSYTARAVAAIAFGAAVAPVDVNVRRVVGRVMGPSPASPGAIQAAADALVDPASPGAWTHALMDLGATVCLPAAPRCAGCPVAAWCAYAAAAVSPGARRLAIEAESAGSPPAGRAGSRPAGRARPRPTGQAGSRPGGLAGSRPVGLAGSRQAGQAGAPPASRRPPLRFEETRRWLRGRIVERLRDAPGGGWTTFDAPIGTHDLAAVLAALQALAGEGLADLAPGGAARLPGSEG